MPRSKFLGAVAPLVLGLVPGWGHIWMRHYFRGLLLFFLVALLLDYAFVTWILTRKDEEGSSGIALAGAVAVWAGSWLDLLRLVTSARSSSGRDRLERVIESAQDHERNGQPGQAEELLEEALRIDPGEPDALLALGRVRYALGKRHRAHRVLRRAQRSGDAAIAKEAREMIKMIRREEAEEIE